MTKRDLFSVALKVIGIYFIIQGVLTAVGIPTIIPLIQKGITSFKDKMPDKEISEYIFFSILNILVPAFVESVIGYLMLHYSENISNRLIREDKEIHTVGSSEWQKGVFAIALKIVGLYFFLLWLPTVILTILGSMRETHGLPDTIKLVIIMTISLYLIFWTNQLLGLIYRKKDTAPNPEAKL